ncbi:hypothetical protein STEG23_009922 [Scotinomys teguina]
MSEPKAIDPKLSTTDRVVKVYSVPGSSVYTPKVSCSFGFWSLSSVLPVMFPFGCKVCSVTVKKIHTLDPYEYVKSENIYYKALYIEIMSPPYESFNSIERECKRPDHVEREGYWRTRSVMLGQSIQSPGELPRTSSQDLLLGFALRTPFLSGHQHVGIMLSGLLLSFQCESVTYVTELTEKANDVTSCFETKTELTEKANDVTSCFETNTELTEKANYVMSCFETNTELTEKANDVTSCFETNTELTEKANDVTSCFETKTELTEKANDVTSCFETNTELTEKANDVMSCFETNTELTEKANDVTSCFETNTELTGEGQRCDVML